MKHPVVNYFTERATKVKSCGTLRSHTGTGLCLLRPDALRDRDYAGWTGEEGSKLIVCRPDGTKSGNGLGVFG